MQTEIIPAESWEKAIPFLQQGIPIVIPTETVYGLAAPISIDRAIERIFEIKGRPQDNPLIVHVANLEQALSLIEMPSPHFMKLAELFWPGPLTLVMKKKGKIAHRATADLPSIAIRLPETPIVRRLIEVVGPLAAPSANLSGRPSPTNAADVLEDLQGRVPLILDGGSCFVGIESTVVLLSEASPVILRPGKISQEEIEDCLGLKMEKKKESQLLHSPGVRYRHYAPQAHVRFVTKGEKGAYVLSTSPKEGAHLLSEASFYAALREADRLGMGEIQIELSEDLQSNQALIDRVMRSAGHI